MLPVDTDDGSIGGAGNPTSGSNGSSEDPNIRGKNLRDGNNLTLRPLVLTSAHLYNLRNQCWAVPRATFDGDDSTIQDMISQFRDVSGNRFPSNADNPNFSIYANTTSSNNKYIERFNPKDISKNPVGSTPAPMGYFIIDALERGASRINNLNLLNSQYPQNVYKVDILPTDKTPGGPTVLCEYAGRIWFSGFSGGVIDGDNNSPRMSSYVLYSQVVTDQSSIANCYQQADPTNKDDSNLVESDGGFIRIEGAYGIVGMVSIGKYMAVIAGNGVWLITGGNNSGFKATDYKVDKITNNGCISPGSIVVVDNTLFYWGKDGIYRVAPNQFGDYSATNITEKTIQKFYTAVDPLDIQAAEGVYDSYERKAKWLYGQRTTSTIAVRELVLDLILGAFYPATIGQLGNSKYPMVIKGVTTDPFRADTSNVTVVVQGTPVVIGSDTIIATTGGDNIQGNVKETKYLVITDTTSTVKYSFGTYNVADHYDWLSINGIGVDAKSHLITGTLSAGDFQRQKDVPYITFYFNKTETGFDIDPDGEYIPMNQSSCLVFPMWNWSNDPLSGKWGRQFQAYRFKRHYFPTGPEDLFNNGYYVVSSRSKLRGNGNVLSLKIESEEGKHMELLGWSMVIEANQDV